ncbi:MAG: glycerol-3-phosphate 1-O-acyltransferase PlsY [Acutalibacteraceae bacterium]|nr:glycerol-3-phosphate 1-O-acyltransferase PlsY [Clostridiales bacterium]
MNYLLCLLIGYVFGCLQTSYIIGKLVKKVDIRDFGSGNSGATNAIRVFGKNLGMFCLIMDALKGVAAISVARYCLDGTTLLLLVTGFGVILGHNYPFYMNFKGGKGIAASLGIFLAIDYRVFFLAGIPSLIFLAMTKYMSLASLSYSLLLLLFMGVFYYNQPQGILIILSTAVFTALAFWRHKDNIKRLASGTERRISKNKNK